MEYAGISGVPDFVSAAQKLVLGDECPALSSNRVCSAQSISGTGALRVAGEFIKRFYPFPSKAPQIYVPNPTWGNHNAIFRDCGLTVKSYRYYNAGTCGLDIDGMIQDIKAMPYGSVVLLHACAHNPTGVDPTPEQWDEISKVVMHKGHFPFFDSAYQGFASGDTEKDAYPIRQFIKSGQQLLITQSFAKNLGLYGQRIGAVHFVCDTEAEKNIVDSQLKIVIRPMYSNPPVHGARLVATILNDPQLNAQWRTEVKLMADRIINMRQALTAELKSLGSTGPKPGLDWSHINNQIGMFCFTGLNAAQSKRMIDEFHVYLTSNGRISMAGVTTKNVKHVANAIHQCTK